jgi:hypothetical protein
MGEPAVTAPYRKVPAADRQVMGAGGMAVTAFGSLHKLPEVVTTDPDELPFLTDILNPGDKNPGSPAVVADNMGLVRHGRDDLVGIFFAVVTVRAVAREDETFTHERY